MKIALFWPIYYPQSNAGAVRGNAFAKYLVREGADVSLFISRKKIFYQYNQKSKDFSVEVLKTYDTVSDSLHFLFAILYLPISIGRIIKKLKKMEPDLVISSPPGLFLSFESLIAAKYLRIPYILDVRDTWELQTFTHSGRLRNLLKIWIEKFCCVYSDLIFAVTPTLREMIIKSHGISPDRVKVVYNGADLERFSSRNNNKTYDLIFIGSPAKYRDLYNLFEAFSIVIHSNPNITFTYIGWEITEYTQKLKKHLQEINVTQNIKFIDKIPHERIPDELSKARIGIVALVNETAYRSSVGAKTYEYLASGLPIVCLGPPFKCELEKIINENKVGIYTSTKKDFADSILFLLNNEEARSKLGRNALETAKKFDRSLIIHEAYVKYISIFAKNI